MAGATETATPWRRLAAWGVHLLTASSAPAGMLAILATLDGDVRRAFLWMAYTVAIDAIDGTLARAVEVKRVLPTIDGARLDDIVDYFTYVLVPTFFVVHMRLVPPDAVVPCVVAITVSSAYGFSRTDAKTTDHFFTGFPSYWNLVAFYLYALEWSPWANATTLLLFAAMVFVPIRYVYPSRTAQLRRLTVGLGCLWGAALLWGLWHADRPPRALVTASLAYPVYYAALSLLLQWRR